MLGLKERGNLQSGQCVFINGASGGVGSYAIRIAKNIGAEVWATCSGKNIEYVKSLGADQVIDYSSINFKELSGKFDVFLDVAVRSSFGKASSVLSAKGTYVSLLPISPGFAFGWLQSVFSSKSSRGVIVAPKPSELSMLANWLSEDKLKISIDSSFSLADATKALLALESKKAKGKIAIIIEP